MDSRKDFRKIAMLFLVAVCVGSSPVSARDTQSGSDAPSGKARIQTGKERLGEKWTDDQRVDNCKVPLGKRGNKPRSDDCSHIPSS